MANDKAQYREALKNWEQLHDDKAYSVPPEVGRVAVLCSYHTGLIDAGSGKVKKQHREVKKFRSEALQLADFIMEMGQGVEVVLDAQSADIDQVLQDPTFSDVVAIGHGDLSLLFINNANQSNIYTWHEVSLTADHLKTGEFVQRHCGMTQRKLPVPLGAFAMADHRNVFAPVNRYFNPSGLMHHHNTLLMSVSPNPVMSYEYVTGQLKKTKAEYPAVG